jgi:hypothetical protein
MSLIDHQHEPCCLERQEGLSVSDNAPVVAPSDLHIACGIARCSGVPAKRLGKAIANLPILSQQVFAIQQIEDAFQKTIEAFRKSNLRITSDKEGQVQVFIPLRQALQPLGIVYPEADDEALYNAVVNFCTKFGIDENDLISFRFEDYCVPATNVIGFIEAAQLPNEIAVRLTRWFTAFLAERIAGARWSAPLREEVDIFR